MVRDLDMPLDVIVCPTVREADGLAMSSRNVYLQPAERAAAASLSRALNTAAALYRDGARDAGGPIGRAHVLTSVLNGQLVFLLLHHKQNLFNPHHMIHVQLYILH